MSLEALLQVLPIHSSPVERGNASAWEAVERELGTQLPSDYKEYINTYGSGALFAYLWIYNLLSAQDGLNISSIKGSLGMYEVMKDGHPHDFPYALYPDKEGLLPCGRTEDSVSLMWKTIGAPDEWPVVLVDPNCWTFEEMNCNLTEFIRKFVKHELVTTTPLYPKDLQLLFMTPEEFSVWLKKGRVQ